MARYGEEPPKTFFRSDRFFNASGKWFAMTREGTQLGPFDNRHEAQVELDLWLRDIGVIHQTDDCRNLF